MQLFDIVVRYDTLQNVISSVTRNLTSILLTLILALIFIYDYSILGYIFFPEDFMMTTNPMASTCPAGEWEGWGWGLLACDMTSIIVIVMGLCVRWFEL